MTDAEGDREEEEEEQVDYDGSENVEENGSDDLGLEGAEDVDVEAYAMKLYHKVLVMDSLIMDMEVVTISQNPSWVLEKEERKLQEEQR